MGLIEILNVFTYEKRFSGPGLEIQFILPVSLVAEATTLPHIYNIWAP
jgi:hypothetical protein